MKKVALWVLLALLLVSCACAEMEDGEYAPYEVGFGEDGCSYIYGYDGDDAELTLPDSFVGYGETSPLRGITDEAFMNCGALEVVTIPEGVTDISSRAFYGCGNLRKVVLPSTLRIIEEEAFANCANLREIVLPESAYLYRVAENAFDGCGQLALTDVQREQFTETEAVADARQQAAFVTDTENLTELSDYIGTDLFEFVEAQGDMEDCDYTDGIGYRNKEIEVYSSWMMDDILIERISIERKNNYCIFGIYAGMDLQQAREMLLNTGWAETEPTGWGMFFENAYGDAIVLEHNGTQFVEKIWLEADPMIPDAWLGEDSSYEAAGMAHTTGDVNLRTGPGLDYESIGVIPSGTTVDYLGESSVDDRGVVWYCVQYGDLIGWGSSKYVKCD